MISSKGVSRARFSASDPFSITRTGDDRHEGNENAPEQLFPNLSPVLSSCTTTCQRVEVLRPSIILSRLRDALGTSLHGCASLLVATKCGEGLPQDARHSCQSESTAIPSTVQSVTGPCTSFPFLGRQRPHGRSLARHFCLSIIPKHYAVAFVKRMPSVFFPTATLARKCGHVVTYLE